VGQLVGLYGTGGGRRPALTRAVVFVFAYLPEAFNQSKTKNRTAVARSGWQAKGRKCKWAFVRLLNMRCTLIPIHLLQLFAKLVNYSTNHQCGAHVLRREDLHFSGLQPDRGHGRTPLNQDFFSCASMARKKIKERWP